MVLDWLSYVADMSVGLVAVICLFEGTRRIALSGVSPRPLVLSAAGFGICVVYGALAYWGHTIVVDTVNSLEQDTITAHLPLPNDWGEKCCKDTRQSSSLSLVRAAYFESGVLSTYFDSEGKRKQFIPNSKEISEREKFVASMALLKERRD